MSLALRFAGFEVTDTLMWLHGQGFPKGGDVGKRIDEMLGAEREVVGEGPYAARRVNPNGGRTTGEWEHAGHEVTAPATPEASRWHDCSTTLKPAWEPIILAQKPHQGSAARNCVEHGAGALRVGACRIGWASEADKEAGRPASFSKAHAGFDGKAFGIADRSHRDPAAEQPAAGRWPANIALDEEAAAALDEQSGDLKSGGGDKRNKSAPKGWSGNWTDSASKRDWTVSSGGASRFFYCAKANKGDRDEGLDGDARNRHPTVKPEALMRWLSRLVCPPWGELLDPFAGSGSTGKAAALEGLRATLVEREPDFAEVAQARVGAALRRAKIDS
jgi:site-specific DNA-methyltransferase (adenine-specific)